MFKTAGGKLYGVFVSVIAVLTFKHLYAYMYGFKSSGFIMCYLVKKNGKIWDEIDIYYVLIIR